MLYIYIMSSKIQAVLFDNKKFNTTSARKKLKEMKLKPIKRVHKTENFLRYRIVEPNDKRFKYRIKKNKSGVNFVFMIKK